MKWGNNFIDKLFHFYLNRTANMYQIPYTEVIFKKNP